MSSQKMLQNNKISPTIYQMQIYWDIKKMAKNIITVTEPVKLGKEHYITKRPLISYQGSTSYRQTKFLFEVAVAPTHWQDQQRGSGVEPRHLGQEGISGVICCQPLVLQMGKWRPREMNCLVQSKMITG